MSASRNVSPWAYWALRLAELPDPDPCPAARAGAGADAQAITAWRARVRTRLEDRLGAWPPRVEPNVEVVAETAGEGFVVRELCFSTERHMAVLANLLVPDGAAAGAPRPGVLAIHGHGLDKDKVCGIHDGDPRAIEAIRSNRGDYAAQLARRGFVVLAPDLRGFGTRAERMLPLPEPDDEVTDILTHHFSCDYELVCALLMGTTPLTLNLWDLQRSLDVLGGLPEVDAARLGVAGWSYGGALALLLAAIDERARASVVSSFFSSWRSAHRLPWNLCGSQILPGLLGALEHVDVAALVAPRPMLFENARDDVLFPVRDAETAFATLQAVYAAVGGRPDDAELHVFAGDHSWNGERAIPFLARVLDLPPA